MRFKDLLGLALSALFQQKVRAVLTTLGVVFGTIVLVFSLSVGRGVQDAVVREYSRFGELRKITVYSAPDPQSGRPPVKVEGSMNNERRERLRQAITQRGPQDPNPEGGVRLTPSRLQALRGLDHVTAVVPLVHRNGRVLLGSKVEEASTVGVPPDHTALGKRIVAGRFLEAGDTRGLLVSEYLLYRLGIVDDVQVETVLGNKVRLEFVQGANRTHQLLHLFDALPTGLTRGEERLAEKVVRQLPAALDKMEDLTPRERQILKKLLKPPETRKVPERVVVSEEFVIVGVFRFPSAEERRERLDWWAHHVDVVMPGRTAEELFFRSALNKKAGLDQVVVEVDDVEHVSQVAKEIEGMGLRCFTLMTYIERERLLYLLIFGGMTLVSVVALIVAALGITNTMLMSILERTREVGIMKAVGARDWHIKMIFLVEGALIGLVGGLLGLLLGWLASMPGDQWVRGMVEKQLKIKLQESLFAFPPWLLIGAPLFACVVTTLAAAYPAWRAARINPVTALRHE